MKGVGGVSDRGIHTPGVWDGVVWVPGIFGFREISQKFPVFSLEILVVIGNFKMTLHNDKIKF